MENELLAEVMQTGGSFFIGLVLGIFIGWFAHKFFKKAGSAAEPLRTLFGVIIILVWSVAATMSIFAGFDIPIYFHIFAGLVLAPMFDPEGKVIDRLLGRGKK